MHYISIKLHEEVHTLWLSKHSGWMEASVFLTRTLKTKTSKKDGKFHCPIRLRFYPTMTCKILLRLYHCQIRPIQSLCTHWNSVKVYWADVLTPPPLSRATIDYKSKIITTWTNWTYGYPINDILPRILQQNLPFLLLDHESLKWHVPVFLFYSHPLICFWIWRKR